MRLIDADALEERWDGLGYILEQTPAVDAVEVVRCKDCKWCVNKDEVSKCGQCVCINRDVFSDSPNDFEVVYFDDYCSYGGRIEI